MARRGYVKHPLLDLQRRYFHLIRRSADSKGVLRVDAGPKNSSTWDYMPTQPSAPLDGAIALAWTFKDPVDILTDQVSATFYKWREVSSGTGTPLAVQDAHGGVAKVINGAGDNDFYVYESAAEIVLPEGGKQLWFSGEVKVSELGQCDMFFGLSAKIGGVGNIFDTIVNGIGFYLIDGSSSIYSLTAATSKQATGHSGMEDDEWIKLGFRYDGVNVYFFIGDTDTFKCIHEQSIPSTELCVAFGLRNGEADAKSLSVRRIFVCMDE